MIIPSTFQLSPLADAAAPMPRLADVITIDIIGV